MRYLRIRSSCIYLGSPSPFLINEGQGITMLFHRDAAVSPAVWLFRTVRLDQVQLPAYS